MKEVSNEDKIPNDFRGITSRVKIKRPYTIEYRKWTNGYNQGTPTNWRDWYSNYKTEKRRDQAVIQLNKGHARIGYEFRAKQ